MRPADLWNFVDAAQDIYFHEEPGNEWEDVGKGPLMDGIYSTLRHNRCGTVVNIAQGSRIVCPECNPEEWNKGRSLIHG